MTIKPLVAFSFGFENLMMTRTHTLYRRIQKKKKKKKLQENTGEYREIQENTGGYKRIQGNIRE